MPLKFLQETHQTTLGKIKKDLSFIDPNLDIDSYDTMSVRSVQNELDAVTESVKEMRTAKYGSWLRDPNYIRATLLIEALDTIVSEKRGKIRNERLVPGATYYSEVSRFGSMLEGKQAIFMGTRVTGWMPLRENAAVAKARQVLRYGNEEDFRQIYIGMADGRVDALNTVSFSHIAESSEDALSSIEDYCDSRWDGAWPWETEAPEKLKMIIENREEQKMKRIEEMQRGMARLLREMDDSNLSQYEMVSAAQEMMSKVDSIIGDLGKLSSTGIEVMAQAKATGEDGLVEPMQGALGDPLNGAVSALTDLKAALASATNELTGGSPAGDDMGDMGDMGSPADAMGAPMGGGDDIDALADVDITGDEEERPMKGV